MSTIAIVGAGSGVGASVASRFGREGFRVALLSRNQEKLDGMAAELKEQNITARGFAVDVRDSAALQVALHAASSELGPIEVLQYSPIPHRDFRVVHVRRNGLAHDCLRERRDCGPPPRKLCRYVRCVRR